MKLTKKEAIENHRKMWHWIATMLKSERYKAFDYMECGTNYRMTVALLKGVYLNMIGLEGEIFGHCFCCEYSHNQDDFCGCAFCPVIWDNNVWGCEDGEYGWLIDLPYIPENLPKAAELALRIANLPERED